MALKMFDEFGNVMPDPHAPSHAAAGEDPIAPADIGAQVAGDYAEERLETDFAELRSQFKAFLQHLIQRRFPLTPELTRYAFEESLNEQL